MPMVVRIKRGCLMSKEKSNMVLTGIVAALVFLLCVGCQLNNAAEKDGKKAADSAEYTGARPCSPCSAGRGCGTYRTGAQGEQRDWWNLHSQKRYRRIY